MASIGTVKVPARIIITAGTDTQHEIATSDTELEVTMTEPHLIGANKLVLTPDGQALRLSTARSLREAADRLEAAAQDSTPIEFHEQGHHQS